MSTHGEIGGHNKNMNKIQEINEMYSTIGYLYFSDILYLLYPMYRTQDSLDQKFQLEAAINAKVLWAIQANLSLQDLKDELEKKRAKRKEAIEDDAKKLEEKIKVMDEQRRKCVHVYQKQRVGFFRKKVVGYCEKCGEFLR